MTVCLIFILKELLELKSKHGDITAAFLYASLEEQENVFEVEAQEDSLWFIPGPLCTLEVSCEKLEACGMSQSRLGQYFFIGMHFTCL